MTIKNEHLKKRKYDSEETLNVALDFFNSQISLAENLNNFIHVHDKINSDRLSDLFPLLVGIVTAGKSIILVTNGRLATEAFILSRAFLERSINFCYLMSCNDKELQDFIDYALQKGFRATNAKKKTATYLGLKYKISEPNEWLGKKLKKFTSNKGKEIPRWTKLSFRDRLNYVQKEIKDLIGSYDVGFYENLYEDASETSHGTLYGTLFHTGMLSGAVCPIGGLNFITHYVSLLLCKLGDLIDCILEIIILKTDIDLNSYKEQSHRNNETVNSYIKKAKEKTKSKC